MFDRIMGKFLTDKGKLTESQLDSVYGACAKNRARLGVMAVSEKLMTIAQAEEINALQATRDVRFGDLAVENGYLSEADLERLVELQNSEYMTFLQTILDYGYMSMEDMEEAVKMYCGENRITEEQLAILKAGCIEDIIPIFVGKDFGKYDHLLTTAFRCIYRLVDNGAYPGKVYTKSVIQNECAGYQKMHGKEIFTIIVTGKYESVKKAAIAYTREEIIETREDALDALCELINCIDGMYCSSHSTEDELIDIDPPGYSIGFTTVAAGSMVIMPIYLCGGELDIIITQDDKVSVR